MKWIALTGLPRSGTTLCCFLLNKLTNSVALHEPINPQRMLKGKSRKEMLHDILDFYKEQEKSLYLNQTAISKNRNNTVPDNPIPSLQTNLEGKRKSNLQKGPVKFEKNIDKNTQLIIKHPPLFTGMLPELNSKIPTYVALRNPFSTMMSWNSVDFPISNGHIPTAEFIDPSLKETLKNENDKFIRQGIILQWFYDRYLSYITEDKIIYYEDIIETKGKALHVINEKASIGLDENLLSKNTNKAYDFSIIETVYQTLMNYYKKEYEKYYSLDQIDQLYEVAKSKR